MDKKKGKIKQPLDENGNVRLEFEKYNEKVNGKYTFVGVMRAYIDDVTKRWNPNTQQKYFKEYNELLFPRLDNNKAIDEYTKDEFMTIVDDMCKEFKRTSKIMVIPSRKEHYRRLISVVTEVSAEKLNYIDQFAKNKPTNPKLESEEEISKRHAKARRSLTVTEELEIYERIIENKAKEPGEKIGLAIMYSIGLRNEEACGLNYGDIITMERPKKFDAACVVSSTKGGSDERQAGGKTLNAPRIIPLPDALAELLRQRREYLEKLYSQGMLSCVGVNCKYKKIDELPIACKGNDYGSRCCSNDLTKAAKSFFDEIKLNEDLMKEIEEEISQRWVGDFDEKDPTAYLLRRNFGGHLVKLGFNDEEIHYLMGHKNEGTGDIKSRYTNPDTLYKIYEKLSLHPIVGSKPEGYLTVNIPSKICEGPNIANRWLAFYLNEKEPVEVELVIRPIGVENLKVIVLIPKGTVDCLKVRAIPSALEKNEDLNIIQDYFKMYAIKKEKRTENAEKKAN